MTTALLLTAMMVLPALGEQNQAASNPVLIGLTAEFGLKNSTSAQAIEMGIRVAMEEINSQGGVLGGRQLALEVRDDRSVPARAIENLNGFASMKDVVAVFGGRFSPVVVEIAPVAQKSKMILLCPWSSADEITSHGDRPNYCFRLSLTDKLAMSCLIATAEARGLKRVGLMLPNTAWGRSNFRAAEKLLSSKPDMHLARTQWYNWGDRSLLSFYREIVAAEAEAVILVANDLEAGILVNEMLELPKEKRLPILSHWGVTGGTFFENSEKAIQQVDFSVVQTFSFFRASPKVRDRFMSLAGKLYPGKTFEEIKSPVGVAHAYDLTHLLAIAIDKAGSADRTAIRDAMEALGTYEGLVATLDPPFTPENHEALGMEQVFMARYRNDGALTPIPNQK
jgi:branched-chain amino acid transport system substrate-binding protein